MDAAEKLAKVQQVVSQILDVEEHECMENASLVDDLGADSLDVVEVVMGIEEAFEIEIPDDDADRFKMIGDITKYLNRKVK